MFSEEREDQFGIWTEQWECAPPERGIGYRVLEDEWDATYRVRTIKRIELIERQPTRSDEPETRV